MGCISGLGCWIETWCCVGRYLDGFDLGWAGEFGRSE